MSYETEDVVTQAELYFVVGLLSVLGVVGSGGNALVLYVFSSKRDGLVSTLFITVLAVVDMTTCMFIVPFTIVMELVEFNVPSDFVCKLYQFLITSNIPFSALVMAAIAVDRYLSICRPFCRLLNVARARWVVAVLALSAGGLGLGGSLTHGVYQRRQLNVTTNASEASTRIDGEEDELTPTTTTTMNISTLDELSGDDDDDDDDGEWVLEYTGVCSPTDLVISEQFGMAFQKCYNGVFISCLLVVCVLYALIYRSVRQRRLWREKHKTSVVTMSTTTQLPPPPQQQQQQHQGRRHLLVPMTIQAEATSLTRVCDADDAHQYDGGSRTTGQARQATGNGRHVEQMRTAQSGLDGEKTTAGDGGERDRVNAGSAGGESHPTKATGSSEQLSKDDATATAKTSSTSELERSWSGSSATSPVLSAATFTETVDLATVDTSKPVAVVAVLTPTTAAATATMSLAAAQKNRIANVKTAAMLFVVTLVFVLTFMPALSMTVRLIPYNMTVFYMYFAYNVANPIIYSFMNQNFCKQLARMFGSKRQF